VSLPDTPNRETPRVLKEGDKGWPTFALQRGLRTLGYDIAADGDFGPNTDAAVKRFQTTANLTADGIAGPATQSALVRRLDAFTHDANPALPGGLIRGFCETESGNALGAVNWSVAGGVDCGVMQVRVYGPPYGPRELRYAFAPGAAMERTAADVLERYAQYRRMTYASRRPREFAMRCAALAHNWPYAAEQYARNGGLPNPYRIASWVPEGVKFPDGYPVRTWKDWAEFYAMGGAHGEGRVTQYVRDWG
jgi:hypothetical protein